MKPLLLAIFLSAVLPCAAQINHALGKPVTTSSARADHPAANAVDGVISDTSRWITPPSPTGHWLEIDLGTPTTLRQAHIYSGSYSEPSTCISGVSLQSWNGTSWSDIPGTLIQHSKLLVAVLPFTSPVTTTKIRVLVPETNVIRIRDVSLWENPTPLFTGMEGPNLPVWHPAHTNLALGKPVSSNGLLLGYKSAVTDGNIENHGYAVPPIHTTSVWVEVNLTTPTVVAEAHVYLHAAGDAEYVFQAENGGTWTDIPSGTFSSIVDDTTRRRVIFDNPVTTSRIRYLATAITDYSRLKEITLWGQTNVPFRQGLLVGGPLVPATPVALNQIGFQKGAPKRFTAITCADGTPFRITSQSDTTPLFTGTIQNGLGDFTSFDPGNSGPYLVHVTPSAGDPGTSDPFLILDDLIKEKYLTPAVQFMIDARSGVGSHPSATGGTPWRDGIYYSFEIPSLVHLLLTRRNEVVSLPREIDWEADKARILSPAYDSEYQVIRYSTGFLEAIRRYYTNHEAPRSNAPDIVKLLHFGMGITLERPAYKDYSGDLRPEQINAQTVEWAAWILYAWPVLREWLPESFYIKTRDFAFAEWGISKGLDTPEMTDDDPSSLEIDPLWHPSAYTLLERAPFKGRNAPGHSIWPNLLMHEVALREGRGDASIYLQAAQTQAQWIIDNIDWNDPRTTKGHRMSECKTMPGLVHLLRNYPSAAPAGLAAKIEQWADVMIARSANAYDYRRYSDSEWSIPALANNWNEPGNLAGFPACALSASWTLGHAPAKQQRLREISWSAIDCLFGRNPLLRASPSRPTVLHNDNAGSFPDIERGWPKLFTGSVSFHENTRGALCSAPGTEHFPNNPEAPFRGYEPWTNFNSAWNVSLAYLSADLDGTRETHAIPQPFTAPAETDANHDQIPDLIQHASTGLTRPYEKPTLSLANGSGSNTHTLEVLHNLQAYDSNLIVEWTTTLGPNDWHPATYQAAEDVPHNNGTLTRKWHIPDEQPGLFYRLRATRE